MRETRSSGSVEGVMSNRDPYSDWNGIPSDVNTEWANGKIGRESNQLGRRRRWRVRTAGPSTAQCQSQRYAGDDRH